MAVNRVRAVLLANNDDVAAVLAAAAPQTPVAVTLNPSGKTVLELAARQPVPFGHKIAIRDIANGTPINRYGYPIGIARRTCAAWRQETARFRQPVERCPSRDDG